MPLTVPAWIAAIATAVIAVGVTVLAGLAGNALGARSRQVADQRELISQLAEALTLQVKDLRLSMDERRRAQACQVFIELTRFGGPATPPTGQITATVQNNSQQPVYDAPDDPAALSAFLTFRDAAGIRWTVREDGTLSDISSAPEARAPHG